MVEINNETKLESNWYNLFDNYGLKRLQSNAEPYEITFNKKLNPFKSLGLAALVAVPLISYSLIGSNSKNYDAKNTKIEQQFIKGQDSSSNSYYTTNNEGMLKKISIDSKSDVNKYVSKNQDLENKLSLIKSRLKSESKNNRVITKTEIKPTSNKKIVHKQIKKIKYDPIYTPIWNGIIKADLDGETGVESYIYDNSGFSPTFYDSSNVAVTKSIESKLFNIAKLNRYL